MKKVVYSPDAMNKLFRIKQDVYVRFGAEVAKRAVSKITSSIRDLQQYEMKGPSVEKLLGVTCDYRMLYTGHNYVFYKVQDTRILIVDIYDEREDFMWKLFGINTESPETGEYWDE